MYPLDEEEEGLTVAAPAAPQLNPTVRDYLLKRKAERAQLEGAQKENTLMPKAAAALAALGAGFQGGNAAQAGMGMLDRQDKTRRAELTDFDTGTDRSITENELMDEDDPESEQSKMADQLARKMGYKGGPVSASQFKKFSPAMEKMLEIESRKLDREEARAERRYLHGVKSQERKDLLDEKKEAKELTLAVPGYDRTGEVLPKPEEAAKLRKATAISQQLSTKINRMKDLVKQYGSFEYGGEGGQEMESLATEIQLLGKSPELYELGVLAGPDLDLLTKITSSPDSWKSLFTRDATRQKQLDTQMTSLQQKLGSTATSLGYVPKTPPASTVRMQGPDGKVRNIPASDVAAAEAAGGKRLDKVAGQ